MYQMITCSMKGVARSNKPTDNHHPTLQLSSMALQHLIAHQRHFGPMSVQVSKVKGQVMYFNIAL